MADVKLPEVTPLEGKTTIDDKLIFDPLRLSYESARAIASKIVRSIVDHIKDQVVVVVSTSVLADFANLQAAYLTLEGLTQEYSSIAQHAQDSVDNRKKPATGFELFGLTEGAAATAATAVGALLGTAAAMVTPIGTAVTAALGVLSLFREDVEYHGVNTSVDRLAFEIDVAASLKSHGAAEAFVPDLMTIPLAEAMAESLRGRLAATEKAKAAAWATIAPLVAQLITAEAELDQATQAATKDPALIVRLTAEVSTLRRDTEPLVGPLGRADQRFNDLQTQWCQIDSASELSVMARLLRAEAIHALHPSYLHCAIVASGGQQRITHSLFRTIFTGDGLSFTGGAIARWALLAPNGAVQAGGIASSQQTANA
jgi:hypothetical protein